MELPLTELQTVNAHASDVTACDFGGDFIIATGSSDKSVRLWEWKSGLGYVEYGYSPLNDHKYGITYLSFSPQGTMLASCSRDGSTILWNVRNGNKIHKFPQVNGDTVRVCKFLPNSCNLATGGDNGIVCIWDLLHRTLIRTLKHHEDSVQGLCYSPDASFLLTTCTLGVLKIYAVSDICDTTVNDPSPLLSIKDAHDLGVLCCDFSNVIQSNETSLNSYYFIATGGNDNCLIQWILKCNYSKGKGYQSEINVSFVIKEAHSCAITCVRYNQQGTKLCTSSLDKSIKLWDNEGRCLQTLDAHGRYVNSISFSRDGSMLVSGSNDRSIKIWDITGNLSLESQISKPCTVLSHFGSGDLKGITNIDEDSILLLKGDPEENEVVLHQEIENIHSAVINSVEFNSNGYLATGSGDKTIRLLKMGEGDLYSETKFSPIGQHRYQVNNISFIGASTLATCSLDGNISLWRIDQLETRPIHIWAKSSAGVKCIRANQYGNLVSSHDDGTVSVWSLEFLSAEPLVSYPEHAEAANTCGCSPDGKLICSASLNGDFRLYKIPKDNRNFNRNALHIQEHAHDLGIQSIDFAPCFKNLPVQYPENMTGHVLATCGNDSYARIWKIMMPKNDDTFNKVTCDEWRVLSGHGSSLTCIRFPPNRADLVCTTSTDMQARIWSVYSAQCLHVLEHKALVATCSFDYTCEYLATGCIEGQLYVWKLPHQLIYDSSLTKLIYNNIKCVTDWDADDITNWLKETCPTDSTNTMKKILVRVHTNNLTGKHLINASEQHIYELLDIDPGCDNEVIKYIVEELYWLRSPSHINLECSNNIPHEFLCPITHDIMKDPVKCADGFTYERKAINEWFLSGGNHVSPMTNQLLQNNKMTPNKELKKEIRKYIIENMQK